MKAIKEYDKYMITEEGTVYSFAKDKVKGRQLKPQRASQSKKGYFQVRLFNEEYPNGRLFYIHRLVWETYKGKIPKNKEVDHIDGDTNNNNIENLQVITRRGNLYKYLRSEEYRNKRDAKYSRDDRNEYKRLYKEGFSYRKIGEMFNVSEGTAYRIVNDRKNKKVKVDGKWKTIQVQWKPQKEDI